MQLGISMFGDLALSPHNNKRVSPSQRLQEMIEQVTLADEVGLDIFEVGEHHRVDYAVTSPQIFLAAAAVKTKNIKLGSAVTVLGSSDPVRLYEDFSMVDNLSNGRAHLMLGRGSFIESFPIFGYDLEHYDSLFDEKLKMMLHLNSTRASNVNWEGKLTQSLKNADIYPKPIQESLPIWIAVGGTPASVARAASLGLPIMFAIIGGLPMNFKPLINYYKQAYLAAGHPIENMQIGINSHTFIGESNAILKNYYPYYASQMDAIGKDRGWAPFTEEIFYNTTRPEGAYFMGEPQAVIDKILQQHNVFNHTRFIGQMDIGGPDHRMIMKSIELFGTIVAPAIRKYTK